MSLFDSAFMSDQVSVGRSKLVVRRGGSGPPVLLLHGFPETHAAWHRVAPLLATCFTLIMPDLPGYGDSVVPEPDALQGRFTKRAMADTLVELMTKFEYSTFSVVGHDRGGRVAYRMALDHPTRLSCLAILDVIPSLDMAERMTYETARRMVNWFLLSLPAPIPERLIGAEADLYLRHVIDAWGGSDAITPEAFEEYARCFRNPCVIRAMCEEYRAGDTIDIEHDSVDRGAKRGIACPVLVLWQEGGLTARFGDPLTVWRAWAPDVRGRAIRGGHFLMEESPDQVAEELSRFLVHAQTMLRSG